MRLVRHNFLDFIDSLLKILVLLNMERQYLVKMYIEDTTPEEKRKKGKEDRIGSVSNIQAAWLGTMRSNMASSFGDYLQRQMQSLPCPAATVGLLACDTDHLYSLWEGAVSSSFEYCFPVRYRQQ